MGKHLEKHSKLKVEHNPGACLNLNNLMANMGGKAKKPAAEDDAGALAKPYVPSGPQERTRKHLQTEVFDQAPDFGRGFKSWEKARYIKKLMKVYKDSGKLALDDVRLCARIGAFDSFVECWKCPKIMKLDY